MASIKIAGDTSGDITVSVPAVAGTNTLTLPANTGNIVTTGDSGTITEGMIGDGEISQAKLASGVASTGPAFSATFSANQSISSATFVKLQFDTENFDTNSNYDSTTNYRFTPTVAGYYLFTAQAQFNLPASSGQNILALYKNGTSYAYITNINQAGAFPCPNGSILVSMNGSTDYVEIYGYQQSGSSTIVTNPAYFSGYLARGA